MVGSATVRTLRAAGHRQLILASHSELDLRDSSAVEGLFSARRPEFVVLAAARVGGIAANMVHPADFIRENLQIQINVIDAAWRHGARRLLFLASSCIYPRLAKQPMTEDLLLTGSLEPTNESSAVAKLAGLQMCRAYRGRHGFDAVTLMPCNLYGPGDNFDPDTSHVIPALLRRAHEARERRAPELVVWGTGGPMREFLYVDELASAILAVLNRDDCEDVLNVGSGAEVSIATLAALISEIVGFDGRLVFDGTRPDGVPRKLLDNSRIQRTGWSPSTDLADGLRRTYRWYCEHLARSATPS